MLLAKLDMNAQRLLLQYTYSATSGSQKVIYMGVAADCVYTSTYGGVQNATQQIITNFNTASALYKTTFNVSLGIIELQVQDST